jgi:DNA-binding GntR family transcriptional regulator
MSGLGDRIYREARPRFVSAHADLLAICQAHDGRRAIRRRKRHVQGLANVAAMSIQNDDEKNESGSTK